MAGYVAGRTILFDLGGVLPRISLAELYQTRILILKHTAIDAAAPLWKRCQ